MVAPLDSCRQLADPRETSSQPNVFVRPKRCKTHTVHVINRHMSPYSHEKMHFYKSSTGSAFKASTKQAQIEHFQRWAVGCSSCCLVAAAVGSSGGGGWWLVVGGVAVAVAVAVVVHKLF